ncbi:hypothetical protein ACIPL1_26410 [Pseudomonas sp. NPDC090202]|uniref:hypothetical protein n=1 Tax=unclassified Pseudomonas TaxID=196821 RepID=UPI00382AA014
MSCLICANHAETIQCPEGWEERYCPQCGRYRMSQALVLSLMDQGQIFDIEKMRLWLESRRRADSLPSIEFHEALLVQ